MASCLCLCLGATHAACVARRARFGSVPLSLPLEVFLRALRVLQWLIASHLSYHNRFFFAMLAPVYSATHLHRFPMELKRAYSNDICLLPMPLPWCYIAHVCWVFCVLSFFASDVACGAVVRVLRALQHVFASPLLGRSAFMVQEPRLHPCTPPHILNGCRRVGSWESGSIRRT